MSKDYFITGAGRGMGVDFASEAQSKAVGLAALTLGWLCATRPPMPSERAAARGSVVRVLREQRVPAGMLAVTLFFLRPFALQTYLAS